MIKNGTRENENRVNKTTRGTEKDNDFYLMNDFLDGKDDPKSKKK
jgi:hypothetical protein